MTTRAMLFVLATLLACAEDKRAHDAATPDAHDAMLDRADAMLDQADAMQEPFSCDGPDARALPVSRFDAERECFEPVEELPGLCAVFPYGGPSGTGGGACVIGPNGDAYAVFLRWGEDFSLDLHHPAILDLPPNITPDEQALCSALWNTLRETDEALRTIRVGGDPNGPYDVGPACDE